MLYSILQIIAFQALFLMVYDLFLKRETFFNYNRAYLIVTSILSLILPFIKFSELKTMTTKDVVIHLPEVFIGAKTPTFYDIKIAEQAGIIIEQPQQPIWQVVAIVGIVIASLIFLVKITKLYWLKYKNPKRWQGNVLIVNLIKSSAAFSFFNTIFLGERISETEKPTIYEHEMVHIREYHTVDLLFFELLRIVFWFNPLVYIYQNRIKELHEYIADAKAIKESGKSEYYTSLLNQILDVNQVSFTNTFFNKSLIKKRIAMLQKSKSKQLNLIKYALLIPLVFGMLIYTSTEVRAQEKIKQEKSVEQELTEEELIKKYYMEILEMEKNGDDFFEISKYAGIGDNQSERYIPSKTEYLKFKAYMQYISDGIIKRKSEEGTLTQLDVDRAKGLRMDKFKSYEEFRAFKNTKEEKERWELDTQDGVLKLFVEDLGSLTVDEEKRFNALLKQLEKDDFFTKIVVTDGLSLSMTESFISKDGVEIIKEDVETIEVPFAVVDETPTTFDCKDLESNEARKNCMNAFVNKHIGKNFNTSVADSLSPGKKRVFVQFKIDKKGNVTNILARGPSEALEVEAKRVVATLPQFIPGKQKGKTVVVPFSIPIVFEVKGDNNTQERISYKELVAQRDRILKNSSEENPVVVQLNKQIDALKDKETKIIDIPFNKVEVPPVYPDCNSVSDGAEQRECTVNAINKFIVRNFNMNSDSFRNLPAGKKRIYAHFTIDKLGNVTSVKTKSKFPVLDEEAKRVVELLPQFTPAKSKGEAVDVGYSLPIVIEIVDNKKN
ncbi:M56 family metallopeptidase [uncultured Winogradskyella sp.]|uniref:M56 family metallopeptidase n=1 Tax=uncultured Winogradskyella sp. TaxID=395353 RepID=UPI002619C024|nr:M56 family metallopeptidase [uncultured Winogradskyella sp.]